MPVEIHIDDNGELNRLARALRGMDRDMKAKVTAELVRTTAPTRMAIRASAGSILPHRGGLAALVQGAPLSTKVHMTGNPHVTIQTSAPGTKQVDAGYIRHPVFGNRTRWVGQRITAGYFTNPVKRDMPRIQRGVARTVQRVVTGRLSGL